MGKSTRLGTWIKACHSIIGSFASFGRFRRQVKAFKTSTSNGDATGCCWDLKPREATREERDAFRITRKSRVFFNDAIYKVPKNQSSSQESKSVALPTATNINSCSRSSRCRSGKQETLFFTLHISCYRRCSCCLVGFFGQKASTFHPSQPERCSSTSDARYNGQRECGLACFSNRLSKSKEQTTCLDLMARNSC
jgi:hypothetical protein